MELNEHQARIIWQVGQFIQQIPFILLAHFPRALACDPRQHILDQYQATICQEGERPHTRNYGSGLGFCAVIFLGIHARAIDMRHIRLHLADLLRQAKLIIAMKDVKRWGRFAHGGTVLANCADEVEGNAPPQQIEADGFHREKREVFEVGFGGDVSL